LQRGGRSGVIFDVLLHQHLQHIIDCGVAVLERRVLAHRDLVLLLLRLLLLRSGSVRDAVPCQGVYDALRQVQILVPVKTPVVHHAQRGSLPALPGNVHSSKFEGVSRRKTANGLSNCADRGG
jgi:hypothetical protein